MYAYIRVCVFVRVCVENQWKLVVMLKIGEQLTSSPRTLSLFVGWAYVRS